MRDGATQALSVHIVEERQPRMTPPRRNPKGAWSCTAVARCSSSTICNDIASSSRLALPVQAPCAQPLLYSDRLLVLCLIVADIGVTAGGQALPADAARTGLTQTDPESVGLLASQLKHIDEVSSRPFRPMRFPAPSCSWHGMAGSHISRRSGTGPSNPDRKTMTTDTIFDMASMTKVMVTAPSIILLAEDRILVLDDKVKRFLPNFTGGGKDSVTLLPALNSLFGFAAGFRSSKQWSQDARKRSKSSGRNKHRYKPRESLCLQRPRTLRWRSRFGPISGETLAAFATAAHFCTTRHDTIPVFIHLPGSVPRIAPTESRQNIEVFERRTCRWRRWTGSCAVKCTILRPGGSAASPAIRTLFQRTQITIFAQMFLDQGRVRVVASCPPSIQAMTTLDPPPMQRIVRGYGCGSRSIFFAAPAIFLREGLWTYQFHRHLPVGSSADRLLSSSFSPTGCILTEAKTSATCAEPLRTLSRPPFPICSERPICSRPPSPMGYFACFRGIKRRKVCAAAFDIKK